MMAETVTPESNYDKITVESQYNAGSWGNNSNFNFTTTDGKIYTCVLTNVTAEKIYFRIKRNNDKEWGPESSATDDLVLTSEYQQAYESKSKAFLINTTSGKTTYTITWNNESNQIKYEASEAGGGTGGDDGGSGTPTTNPLTGRVYTQGYYLAGNFFNFSENKVTYDDAVFKFQQQKNDADGNAVYMVEIPASLTAHAQVMSVDEFGKKQKVYGPGSYTGITTTYPGTDGTTGALSLTGSNTFEEGTNHNYWDIQTRNEDAGNYSDGMYKVFITVDKKTGEPSKWEFKHIGNTRVAFFISDAKNATAMPVYDTYKKNPKQFSNKFFASVNLSTGHSYYVISNYVLKKENDWIKHTSSQYGTLAPNGDVVSCPTTNKLFLLGNGGYPVETKDQHNEFSPNEIPMIPADNQQGSRIIEYNCSNGNDEEAKKAEHLGIRGQVIIRGDADKQINSISMVGDAIPGTVKDGVWDYTSTAADMTYDETEKCYKVTLVIPDADYGTKKFRFVGNHKKDFNWHEDSKDDASMKAKVPYDGNGEGHEATSYDPNKVNYTDDGLKVNSSDDDWGIIWNRPAGRWTVRLYFYTYNVGADNGDNIPKTDYYYTISENRELELRDFNDVVYKDVNNKRTILNRGEYKYFRTWSAVKAWEISKDVDIFVVDGKTVDTDKGIVKFSLKKINADPTGKKNVIPSNTGVILATKNTYDKIEGGAQVFERASLTSYNTMVIPIKEYNSSTEATADYKGTNLLKPLIEAQVVHTMDHTTYNGVTGDYYNYLFGFFNAKKGLGVTTGYSDNEFLLGFWISKGTGSFYNNSAYLPILEADAKIMGLGVSHNDFDPTSGAKKVPALFFDFANADDTTGIDEVVNTTVKNNDGKYYTLSGLQVEKPTAGGVYIHNGKKFVVR